MRLYVALPLKNFGILNQSAFTFTFFFFGGLMEYISSGRDGYGRNSKISIFSNLGVIRQCRYSTFSCPRACQNLMDSLFVERST